MTDLTEFLLARIAEERAVNRDEWIFRGASLEEREEMRPTMRKAMAYQAHDLSAAFAGLGWAIVAAVYPREAKRRAMRYADHPDYRSEWAL